jgi:hypothetical protein
MVTGRGVIAVSSDFANAHCYPDENIKLMMFDVDNNDAKLTSCFLQCSKLSKWVATNPNSFCFNCKDGTSVVYHGVQWSDVVHHSPDEMSACHADVKFTYTEKL